ncbi:hypothetical protein OG474_22670 [Kribbella sp. NBC_01505]|uniref:hypothetical protein n=1 Tax=Kribbella sp. NBC_01505 TaxID=2903580 RepID=UPI00386A11F6
MANTIQRRSASGRRRLAGVAVSLVVVVSAVVVRAQPGGAGPSQSVEPVSAEQVAVLERAEDVLIQRCMERAGFRYSIVPRVVDPVPFHFSYVVDDIRWADKHGYGTALRRQIMEKEDPNQRYFGSLPTDEQQAAATALNGTEPTGLMATLPGGQVVQHSDTGCQSEAQRELYGDLPAWYASTKLVENLIGHRYGLVVGNARFQAAIPAWSLCMRDRGYRFVSPEEAHASELSSIAEVRRAGAEARCAVETGLGALARELDTTYDAGLREQHRGVLSARADLQRRALPKARVLSES